MANGLSVDYDIMDQECIRLKEIAENIVAEKEDMMTEVNFLCDAWDSNASSTYREDFASIAVEIAKIEELVVELTDGIKNYVRDVQELDNSYSQR